MALVGVIDSFKTAAKYTVTRANGAGAYVNGLWVPGGTTTFDIVASIQPISGREKQQLPEGFHTKEIRVVYTTTALQTQNGDALPDTVSIDGESWSVIRFERWQAFGGVHHVAYIAREPVS